MVQLIRKQTYITPEQDRELKRVARQSHTTEADILRQALDQWLANETERMASDPFEGLIGFVAGPSQVDHDDIYR